MCVEHVVSMYEDINKEEKIVKYLGRLYHVLS
jgi:hypothetical protein